MRRRQIERSVEVGDEAGSGPDALRVIGELRVEETECAVGATGGEEGVVNGLDLRARHVLSLLDVGGAISAQQEADELGVADDAAAEQGLSAELAVDVGKAGDDAEDGGVPGQDEMVVKVDGFCKDACDRSA